MEGGSFAAAAFFAVYEGHQETVMWFSAVNELLLFSFGLAATICWLLAERSRWWQLSGVTLFALAILSKESAIVLLPLMLLIHPRVRLSLFPYLLLGCIAMASIAQSRANSFRFSDGSSSVQAPFWLTLPHSLWRLLFPWGLVAVLILWRRKPEWRSYIQSLIWMVLALLPYSFLTYSTAIPSRQTYLASAGLAMLVGLAFVLLRKRNPRLTTALAVLAIVVNMSYVWTKKRGQFLARAAPTESLIYSLASTDKPVNAACFPLIRIVAEDTVRFTLPDAVDRLVWKPEDCPAKR